MQREYITDEAWGKMLKFFEQNSHVYIGCERKLKKFLEAVAWMAKSGAPWRMLPEKYGYWNAIFKRFKEWVDKNVWRDLMQFCAEDPDLEYIMIDSTTIRAHTCAAGKGEQEKQGLGRSRGGFTTKIHAKVDALGNPLEFVITPGQESDFTPADYLLGDTQNAYVLCDKGYDSDDFRSLIVQQNNIPVIPGRLNRKIVIEYDKHIYKERSLIENFFSKIKFYRRIFSRFDKSINSFYAFLYFVGAMIWLK